jgi:hypothetical protein
MSCAAVVEDLGHVCFVFSAAVGLQEGNWFVGFVDCIALLFFVNRAYRRSIFAFGEIDPTVSRVIVDESDEVLETVVDRGLLNSGHVGVNSP